MEEGKKYGAHTRHSVKVHIAVIWFKTSYILVQAFWRHNDDSLRMCLLGSQTRHQNIRCHNSQVCSKKQISHLSICGQRCSVGIVCIVTEELWLDYQQEQKLSSSLKPPDQLCWPSQPPNQQEKTKAACEVKRPKREASHFPLISRLTLILPRSRTGTVWFYTSTSNKRAVRPKLYTKSLTRDLKLMYSRLTLVRISINLYAPLFFYIGTGVSLLFRERFLYI